MNAAPYIGGLLVAALGWHITQLTDDIRSTRAVSYDVRVRDGRAVALVNNASKIKPLAGATFALACQPGSRCLKAGSDEINIVRPNAISATTVSANDTALVVKTTLAAGGRIEFGSSLSGFGDAPKFLFVPDENDPLDIYVYDRKSLQGFLVSNYFDLLFASFAFLFAGLLIDLFRGDDGPVSRPRSGGKPR